MFKVKVLVSLILTGMLTVPLLAKQAEEKKAPMDFKEFISHLDQIKNTSLHVEHFWSTNKGKSFTWTGKVVNVKGGRGKAEIWVANPNGSLHKGLNLILVTYQRSEAAKLQIGDEIRFRGNVYNYKGRKGSPIIVYMNNVEILPLAEAK